MALKMVKGSIDRMFDKNLQDLVRGIRNHKEDEAKYISQCIDEIKQELKQDNIAVKANAVCKLTYLQMLGYDISWAAFNIIEVMSASKFTFKWIGYLAALQCFHEGTDVIMLTTNQICKDLSSPSQYDTGVALTDLSRAPPADCVPARPLSLRCPGSRSERPSACNTGLDLDAWINELPSDSESEDEAPKAIFHDDEQKPTRHRQPEANAEELARRREARKPASPFYIKSSRKKQRKEKQREGRRRRYSSLHTESDEDIAPAQQVDMVTEELPEEGRPPPLCSSPCPLGPDSPCGPQLPNALLSDENDKDPNDSYRALDIDVDK
ncbi:AP-3 complex subunit delta-1-like [Trichechus manatus latirostris]|uniref:AP-3 complex subunit delta-1-like n=1 Tax=Trichechus manatus latirostris TaxID=127582 RepID=A0A2Y9RAM1_TRIMA|nr:AP-3 complex subunit delta-1-like [Trichechus manatus latirostris]